MRGDGSAKAIAYFKVGWDQLASSAGPPPEIVEKPWWAGAAKRHWSHPTGFADPTRRWPCGSTDRSAVEPVFTSPHGSSQSRNRPVPVSERIPPQSCSPRRPTLISRRFPRVGRRSKRAGPTLLRNIRLWATNISPRPLMSSQMSVPEGHGTTTLKRAMALHLAHRPKCRRGSHPYPVRGLNSRFMSAAFIAGSCRVTKLRLEWASRCRECR